MVDWLVEEVVGVDVTNGAIGASEVATTGAEPLANPVWVVVMVAVEEVFGCNPVTVTKPEPLMDTEPAVAVPP